MKATATYLAIVAAKIVEKSPTASPVQKRIAAKILSGGISTVSHGDLGDHYYQHERGDREEEKGNPRFLRRNTAVKMMIACCYVVNMGYDGVNYDRSVEFAAKLNINHPVTRPVVNVVSKTNTCPVCGHDAEMTEETHKHTFEVWQCQACRLKFSEFGTGTEWVPAEFLEEETYSAKIWNGKETIDLEFEVIEKKDAHIMCRVNGVFQHQFELSVCNEVEILHVGADLVGMAADVFPYDVVFDDPCCDSPGYQKCMQCQDIHPQH